MKHKEIIIRKTLDLLLKNVKSVEDLKLISYAIEDYERKDYDLHIYKKLVRELKEGFWRDKNAKRN